MSLLWGYTAEKCEGEYCPNDCDNCYKAEIEADGFITPLEQLSENKAKPATDCIYPECEECDKYHGHYCTVPIVVSKQMWKNLDGALGMHHMQIESIGYELGRLALFVEEHVTRNMDGEKEEPKKAEEEELNLTWDDYFSKETE